MYPHRKYMTASVPPIARRRKMSLDVMVLFPSIYKLRRLKIRSHARIKKVCGGGGMGGPGSKGCFILLL